MRNQSCHLFYLSLVVTIIILGLPKHSVAQSTDNWQIVYENDQPISQATAVRYKSNLISSHQLGWYVINPGENLVMTQLAIGNHQIIRIKKNKIYVKRIYRYQVRLVDYNEELLKITVLISVGRDTILIRNGQGYLSTVDHLNDHSASFHLTLQDTSFFEKKLHVKPRVRGGLPHWYFSKDQKSLTIQLYYTNQKVKYRVVDHQNRPYRNQPIRVKYFKSPVITDDLGYLHLNLKLGKNDLSIGEGRIKSVKANTILVLPNTIADENAILRSEKDTLEAKVEHLSRNLVELKKNNDHYQDSILDFEQRIQQKKNIIKGVGKNRDSLENVLIEIKKKYNLVQQQHHSAKDSLEKRNKLLDEKIRAYNTLVKKLIGDNQVLLKKVDDFKEQQTQGKFNTTELSNDIQQSNYRDTIFRIAPIALTILGLLIILFLIFYRFQDQQELKKLHNRDNLIRLLLKELQHRVVNNLATIKARINSKRHTIQDSEAQSFLASVETYIGQLEKVHASLSYSFNTQGSSGTLKKEEVQSKLTEIVQTIKDLNYPYPMAIDIDTTQAPALSDNRFTLIGHCVFELVNNAFKHAFYDQNPNTPPAISIQLREEKKKVHLIVTNNGESIEPTLFNDNREFLFEKIRSMGMHIIKEITTLEKGKFEIFTAGVHQEVKE
ncbi:MAG TPA: hypothetical protein DCS93_21945, partial [Microscillaceae bacterium]|nr:hypothetical protein [Microscillaceae bacterium]